LQLVAPFIHAHAFEHDSFKAQALHVHTDIAISAINENSANNSFSQGQVGENQIIDAITSVASGIKNSVADDIADGIAVMAVFFILALLVVNTLAHFVKPPIRGFYSQRYFFSLQNPRAPPR
jgi:hypothetical protein